MNRFLVLLLLLLSACTSIDYQQGPVPGLERMSVEEHYVDGAELYARCSRCGHLGLELPVACTCINFRTNRAVIWLPRGASQSTIEHERAHGRGYDHPNGELRSRYAAWTKSGGKRIDVALEPINRAGSALAKVSEFRSTTAIERDTPMQ